MKTADELTQNEKFTTAKKIRAGIVEEQEWVIAIAKKMGVPNRTDLGYRALIAVLHSVRDKLNLQQVFQLSSYLPLSIRGIYFEGYDPENVKVMIFNNQLLLSYRSRMGPGNSIYFEKYLDRYGKNKINGEELLEIIREKLVEVKVVNPDIAFQAVMEVMYENIPSEDSKVNNIINLLDMDAEFLTQ